MRLKKIFSLLMIIIFLLLVSVGCEPDEEVVENGGAQIVLKDIETNKDIGEPIVKEGPLGETESFQIPKIDGYIFDGLDEFITIEYTKPHGTYVLLYKKLNEIGPNESRIIFKFVDLETNNILRIDEIVGEIGSEFEYENTLTIEGYQPIDLNQTIIRGIFENEDRVIVILCAPRRIEYEKFGYTVNYLEKDTNKVLHEAKTGEEHLGILDLENHPTIAGYQQEPAATSIEITVNETNNVLNVYYTKDALQWTTITFLPGENATLNGTTTFEVIKEIEIDGPNQPIVTPPEIIPNEGYQTSQTWNPSFNLSNFVSENNEYTAIVSINEEYGFAYQVNYLEKGTNTVLRTAMTGEHPLGTLDLYMHPNIPGYQQESTVTTIEITTDESTNVLNVYYKIDNSQWTTLTFDIGDKAILTSGQLVYQVIKNHPLNGDNQPKINLPIFTATIGYKIGTPAWLNECNEQDKIYAPIVISANVVIDPSQWVEIKFKPGANSIVTETTFTVIKNHPFNGLNQPTVRPPEITPAYGYLLPDVTERWSPNFTEDGQVSNDQTFYSQVVANESIIFEHIVFYYLKGTSDAVPGITKSHELVYGYAGQKITITLQTVKGYKLVNPATEVEITITGENYQTTPIYYEYDASQWVTITFKSGTHSTVVEERTFTVIKNHVFSGVNQPRITPPDIIAEAGYKVPLERWSPTYLDDGQVSENKIYYSQAVVDEYVEFKYKVNYLEKDNTTNILRGARSGFHHIGNLNLGDHPNIPGYQQEPAATTIEITADEDLNVLNVYYTKDISQWTTITFLSGENATLSGITTFEVIKGITINGPNQPTVTPPEIKPNTGYKTSQTWSPSFSLNNGVWGNDKYTAVASVDEDVKFGYTVNYLEKDTSKVLHDAKEGTHHLATLNLGNHPNIPGYNQQAAPTTLQITINEEDNVLNVYYTKDDNQWVTITFRAGDNSAVTETTFTVIKNHPFNGRNQPTVTAPNILPAIGYMLPDSGENWSPGFTLDGKVMAAQIFYSQVVVNPEQWRVVSFNHIGEDLNGNYVVGLGSDTINGIVTKSINLPQKSVTGFTYRTDNPTTYTVTTAPSGEQIVEVKYSRNQYTIYFNANDGGPTPTSIFDVYYGDEVVDVLSSHSIETPTKTGYGFKGWTIDNTGVLLKIGDNY